MDAPPPYPRVPHLVRGRGTGDDADADAGSITELLTGEVAVEEKLDGANVMVWPEGPRVECALRSGSGAADRAGQLGPLRGWVAEHTDALRSLLDDGTALYAEWLLLTHTVDYDRLPSYLVALDLWSEDDGFALVDERNTRCAAVGIATPPERWRGRARSVVDIERHLGSSAYADGPVEGVVVRTVDGRSPRVAKLWRLGFDRIDDAAWRAGRPHNRLAAGATSWR